MRSFWDPQNDPFLGPKMGHFWGPLFEPFLSIRPIISGYAPLNIWVLFHRGSKMGPKMGPKKGPKKAHFWENHTFPGPLCCFLFWEKVPFLHVCLFRDFQKWFSKIVAILGLQTMGTPRCSTPQNGNYLAILTPF